MDFAYILFWPILAFAICSLIEYATDVLITLALIVGRNGDVRWNFTNNGIKCLLWITLASWLWHYNFG